MIDGQIRNALRGISGEFELNRLVGAAGGVVFIITGPAFQAWSMWQGHAFSVAEFCLAFPAGVATISGGSALAVAHKDKNVAAAKVIAQTGAVPTPALDGARVPQGDPPPVDKAPTTPDAELPEYAR